MCLILSYLLGKKYCIPFGYWLISVVLKLSISKIYWLNLNLSYMCEINIFNQSRNESMYVQAFFQDGLPFSFLFSLSLVCVFISSHIVLLLWYLGIVCPLVKISTDIKITPLNAWFRRVIILFCIAKRISDEVNQHYHCTILAYFFCETRIMYLYPVCSQLYTY